MNYHGSGINQHDLEKLFDRLSRSTFRRKFRLGPIERHYLASRGLDTILQHAEKFIEERLAPAFPQNDGKQTPMRNHPVFVAQHATATCCRQCMEKWHGIECGRELTPEQKTYVLGVVRKWLESNGSEQISGKGKNSDSPE